MEESILDINQKDYFGRTPFHLACLHNISRVVRMLLEDPRVDVNLEDNREKNSPFHTAIQKHMYTYVFE